MKFRIVFIIVTFYFFNSCISVPKQTVKLSSVIGTDLKVLENSHTTMVGLFYNEIMNNMNGFIEDVYAPFIINYVLKKELDSYHNSQPSIFEAIEDAATKGGKANTEKAYNDMSDFLKAARTQIEKKRNELLVPIQKQRDSIILNIKISYGNTILASSSVTSYLQSISSLKESQNEVLSVIGLKGKTEELTNTLLKMSDVTKSLLTKGKEIDIKSDDAYNKMKTLTDEIKSIIHK
jgi:vacuolar-type H+-ATPase subunit H